MSVRVYRNFKADRRCASPSMRNAAELRAFPVAQVGKKERVIKTGVYTPSER